MIVERWPTLGAQGKLQELKTKSSEQVKRGVCAESEQKIQASPDMTGYDAARVKEQRPHQTYYNSICVLLRITLVLKEKC